MCNITLLDFKNLKLFTPNTVRLLTTINSLLGNVDGFGYYLFSDKSHLKSELCAIDYWKTGYDEFSKIVNYNGIYHVRKSSLANNKSKEFSHPFNYNNIVVAHNGFLNFRFSHVNAKKYENDIKGNLIDSQKFAIVLSMICEKGKVTIDNIKDALNMFSGAYVLAIKGEEDNFVWLCRGKDRTLFKLVIINPKTEKPVGIVINTTVIGLELIAEFLYEKGYSYAIEELEENTIYKYTLDTYEVEKIIEYPQDSPYVSVSNIVVSTPAPYNYTSYRDRVAETPFQVIIDHMFSSNLLFSDLEIISEIIMAKPIWSLTEDEIITYKDFLVELTTQEHHKGRADIWKEIETYDNRRNLYLRGINYPYFMNTRNELETLLLNIEKERKVAI